MPAVYGVDPDETWEVDYCLESIKLRIERLREAVKDPSLPGAALAEAERELEQYARGSGPIFIVGHAPSLKSYEFMGMAAEYVERPIGAEKLRDEYRWEREVVRWSVRGHRNLLFRRRDGTTPEVPFEQVEASSGGEKRKVVADRTLEVYGTSGVLGLLARMVVDSQRLTEPEKNA